VLDGRGGSARQLSLRPSDLWGNFDITADWLRLQLPAGTTGWVYERPKTGNQAIGVKRAVRLADFRLLVVVQNTPVDCTWHCLEEQNPFISPPTAILFAPHISPPQSLLAMARPAAVNGDAVDADADADAVGGDGDDGDGNCRTLQQHLQPQPDVESALQMAPAPAATEAPRANTPPVSETEQYFG
jgi:hypothetical protein